MSESIRAQDPASRSYRAPPPRQRPLWRTVLWIAGAIVVVAGIIAFSAHAAWRDLGRQRAGGRGDAPACRRRSQPRRGRTGGSTRRPPTVVGVATAALGDIPIQVTALGAVASQANVTVHTRIAGTLMNVYFTGRPDRSPWASFLAQIDVRPYRGRARAGAGPIPARPGGRSTKPGWTWRATAPWLAQDSIAPPDRRRPGGHGQAGRRACGEVLAKAPSAPPSFNLGLLPRHHRPGRRAGRPAPDRPWQLRGPDTAKPMAWSIINQVDPINGASSPCRRTTFPRSRPGWLSPAAACPPPPFDRTGTISAGARPTL